MGTKKAYLKNKTKLIRLYLY